MSRSNLTPCDIASLHLCRRRRYVKGGALGGFTEESLGSGNTTYSLQQHLGRVLPISSNFFLTFVFFRAVYIPIQRLILPHPGVICWAVRKYLCFLGGLGGPGGGNECARVCAG